MKEQIKNFFTRKSKNITYDRIHSEFSVLVSDGKDYKTLEKKLNKYLIKQPENNNKIYRGFFAAIKDTHTIEALRIGEIVLKESTDNAFKKVLATRYKRNKNYTRYRDILESIGEIYAEDQEISDIKHHLSKLNEREITTGAIVADVTNLVTHFPRQQQKINELTFALLKDSHTEIAVKYGDAYIKDNPNNHAFISVLLKRHALLKNQHAVAKLKAVLSLQKLKFDMPLKSKGFNMRLFKEKLKELSTHDSSVSLIQFINDTLKSNVANSADIFKSAFAVLKHNHKDLSIDYGLSYLKLVPDDQGFLKVFSKRCVEYGTQSEIDTMNDIISRFKLSKIRLSKITNNLLGNKIAFNKKEFKQSLNSLSQSLSVDKLEKVIDSYTAVYADDLIHIHEIAFSVLKDCHTTLAIKHGRKYLVLKPDHYAFAKVFVRRLMNLNIIDEAVTISRNILDSHHDVDLHHIVFKYDIKTELIEADELYKCSRLVELENYLIDMEDKYKDSLHYLYSVIHKFYIGKNNEKSAEYAEKSLELGNSPTVMRSLYDLHLTQGHLTKAINSIPKDVTNPTLITKRSNGESFLDLLHNGFPLPEKKSIPQYEPIKGKVFYMLHNRLPYNSGGYATRSHGLLTGVHQYGWQMNGVSRLGYPWDKMPDKVSTEMDEIDGIKYHRLQNGTIGLGKLPIKEYLLEYAKELTKLVEKERPEFIHAASNYMNGIVANYVANSLGIKCIYEVRGLWEITRISRQPEWKNTEYYNLMSKMEADAAKNADMVFTLTEALKDEMISRGVNADKVQLLPNGVNSGRFLPRERNQELAKELGLTDKVVIGFIGSVVGYEGLDYLISATELLVQKGIENFAVLIVGDGSAWQEIKADVKARGLEANVIFTGRVPHDQVEDYYSIVDIAPFPRKGIPVCEMVSPLKPFEAMSMEKAIISSDVAALAEFVFEGQNGVLFKKDNSEDLALKLETLIQDDELRNKLGKQAREWVVEHRDWKVITEKLAGVYDKLANFD